MPNTISKYINPKLIVISLAVILIGASLVFYVMNYRFKNNAEDYMSQIFQLPVEIDSASLSYISDTAKLKEIKISNPPEFKTPWVMTIDELRVSAESLSTRPVSLRDVQIRGVNFYAEQGKDGVLNIAHMYDTLLETSTATNTDEDTDALNLVLAPGIVTVEDVLLFPVGARYSDFSGSIPLEERTPLSINEAATTLSADDLTSATLQSYGYDIFAGMMKLHLKMGLARSRAMGNQFIGDLQSLGETIESTIIERFDLESKDQPPQDP
ncbi:MAG: hypothetical protein ACQEQL_03990 [Pseudomonadota bacterium]